MEIFSPRPSAIGFFPHFVSPSLRNREKTQLGTSLEREKTKPPEREWLGNGRIEFLPGKVGWKMFRKVGETFQNGGGKAKLAWVDGKTGRTRRKPIEGRKCC